MNRICILILLVLLAISCKQPITDNEELKKIYAADQADRQTENIDWSLVFPRDKQRQKRVSELLEANQVNTSEDYANAAMIFQHGMDTIASSLTIKLMRKAIALDPNRDKWLLAAAIDRDLTRKNQPQIYGTQFRKSGEAPWERYPLDSTKVTDKERIEYGVETLAEQQEKLKEMNKEK